jgi:fructokinase
MYAVGDRIVGAPELDQFVQLLLKRGVLVAQHQHLSLDERDGGAAALVRQLDARQHGAVALEEIGVRHELVQTDQLMIPAFIENDANCLALSEVVDGASSGSRVSFAAILGTGCGAGITLGTNIWTGRNALAGEWGHNPLPWPTPQELETPACWCGKQGCIETWVSGPALAADHLRSTQKELTPEQIVQSMLQGDAAATDTWQRYVDRLARSLAHIVNTLDPDVIVLGGGMSRIDALYESLATHINAHTFTRPITTPIRAAVHGDSSGVRGAAWLTRDASV